MRKSRLSLKMSQLTQTFSNLSIFILSNLFHKSNKKGKRKRGCSRIYRNSQRNQERTFASILKKYYASFSSLMENPQLTIWKLWNKLNWITSSTTMLASISSSCGSIHQSIQIGMKISWSKMMKFRQSESSIPDAERGIRN